MSLGLGVGNDATGYKSMSNNLNIMDSWDFMVTGDDETFETVIKVLVAISAMSF